MGSSSIDIATLIEAAGAMGVSLDEAQASTMIRHAAEVVARNATLNLTRLTSDDDVLRLHLLDSLSLVPLLGSVDAPLVDIGSGAGYPGVPVAVATGVPVLLLESRGKKAQFLQGVAEKLRLGASVSHCRAEELGARVVGSARAGRGSLLEPFGAVLARAVAPLPVLVELASPLLRRGGRLLAMKGDPAEEEVERGERAGRLAGLSLSEVVGVSIPGTDAERRVFVFQKVGEPTRDLPRRPGVARKRPLA